MNFINLNCPPLPYFIVGGGCVYRPGDIHERRTIRNVFDLIYVHSGTLYLEQDPFRVELNAGQFFIITPDTPHRGQPRLPGKDHDELGAFLYQRQIQPVR